MNTPGPLPPRRWARTLLVADRLAGPTIAFGVLLLAAILVYFLSHASTLTDQRRTAERKVAAAAPVVGRVTDLCAAGRLTTAGLCDQAAAAQRVVTATTIIPVPGSLPTPEIRNQVDAYLAAHPPKPGPAPTTEQVTAAVAQVYTANPPAAGPPPTPARIAAAVAAYCAGDVCTGAGPTGEQIVAAVTVYCSSNNQCRGAAGDTGPAGSAGPACPDGYTLRPVVLVAPDDSTYDDALACVHPTPSTPSGPAASEEPGG